MVATVSPAADSYEETLSTLRYADRYRRTSPLLCTGDPSTLRYRRVGDPLQHKVQETLSTLRYRRPLHPQVQESKRPSPA